MPAAKKRSRAKQNTTENQAPATTNQASADGQDSQPERQSQFATILIGLLIIASGLLIYNYFQSINQPSTTTSEQATKTEQSTPTPTPTDDTTEQPKVSAKTYTVKAGDSLWSVAESIYGDGHQWSKLAEANTLTTDNQGRPIIEVGQTLTIPQTESDQSGNLAQQLSPSSDDTNNSNQELTETPDTAIQTYTVQHGDTLWSIAQNVYGHGNQWALIFNDSHNNLGTLTDGAPLIHAGNELYIPQAL